MDGPTEILQDILNSLGDVNEFSGDFFNDTISGAEDSLGTESNYDNFEMLSDFHDVIYSVNEDDHFEAVASFNDTWGTVVEPYE